MLNMRLCPIICATLLFAGGVLASEVNVEEGGHFVLNLQTLSPAVSPDTAKCYVVTPQKETIQLFPTDESPDRYEVGTPNYIIGCSVTISEVTESDDGTWELHVETSDGLSKWDDTIQVIVSKAEADNGYTTIKLDQVNYVVRPGMSISVTLSQQGGEEGCFVKHPGSEIVALSEHNIVGVTARDSSPFIACGIQVGPIDESHLGVWELCARNLNGTERCQPANITFANNDWEPLVISALQYNMTEDSIVSPDILSTGVPVSCHAIAPNGDDLTFTATSNYPSIHFDGSIESTCAFHFGPVYEDMFGTWTIYGRFEENSVIHEIQRPMEIVEGPERFTYIILEQIDHVVRPGMSASVMLNLEESAVEISCFVETPQGDREGVNALNMPGVVARGRSPFIGCGVDIGPIDESHLGDWRVCMRNRTKTERCQPASITFASNDWQPTEISPVTYSVSTGAYVYPEISSSGVPVTCHVITPHGDDLNVLTSSYYPGIKLDGSYASSCRFQLGPVNEDMIGNWQIYGRFEDNSIINEIRQTVVLYSQTGNETITAVPASVTISEGSDLYLRLSAPTAFYQSCKLLRPDDTEAPLYHIDEKYAEYCGFMVPQVTSSDTGLWSIVIENSSIFKASSDVHVVKRWEGENNYFTWLKDRPVQETVGPEDAVYCKVEDPQASIIFEGFGNCKIDLEKVTSDHHGFWKMHVGSPGRVLTDEHQFLVEVTEPEAKSAVVTHVTTEKPDVMLSCSLSTNEEVKACKFRDPSGKILLANHGVGEDRYVFHGTGVNVRSTADSHECGIRITNPLTSDLGLWRCAVQTDADEYYGFLTVLCPWAMMDPEVAAAVISEPTLTAVSPSVSALEGDSVTLSCSVQASIKYCYFRASNGSVFNVHPASGSASMQYVGASLEAGECGVKFSSLQASDSGAWSCHVGLTDDTAPEQRASIQVHIDELLKVDQRHENGWLIVEGSVPGLRTIEYCRFVRMDGVGFTTENVPEGYVSSGDHSHGQCRLHVPNPSILEHHPWTVVVKVSGQDVEIARVTPHTFSFADMVPGGMSVLGLFFLVLVLALAVSLAAFMLIPKKNRAWTFTRVHSIRNSLFKKPLPVQVPTTVTQTPEVA